MNNQKKLTIGLIVALITLVTGISYAYFTATFQNLGVRETNITASTMGSLKLTSTEATYTSGNQYPGDMAIQKFTVEPVSKGSGVYELDLTGVIDESIFGNDVEIQLYKSIDNTEVTVTEGDLTQEGENYSRVDTLVTNGLTPIYNKALKNGLNILYQEEFEVIEESGVLKVRENSTSTAYPKYTFYLVYNYKNNGNQNNQMGQTFNGTISGKIIDKKSNPALETLKSLQALNPNLEVTPTTAANPDFSLVAPREENVNGDGKEAQISGLYAMEDDYGTSYYFRGDIDYNYVKFGGFYWRIIRINGDGTIRIIYAGDANVIDALPNKFEILDNNYWDENTTYSVLEGDSFGEYYDDNAYAGYMYGFLNSNNYQDTHENSHDSPMKIYLDKWYENHLKNKVSESYIADSLFCNDRSVASDDTIDYVNENMNPSVPFTSNAYGAYHTIYGPSERLMQQGLQQGNKATLKCKNKHDTFTVVDKVYGNGNLNYSIGLITSDELNVAGLTSDENFNSYLSNGVPYVTMSPMDFLNPAEELTIGMVSMYGEITPANISGSFFTRPVINLKSNSLFAGNGTAQNPFTVE